MNEILEVKYVSAYTQISELKKKNILKMDFFFHGILTKNQISPKSY